MARPAIIRTKSGGEIILKNVEPELTKQIRSLIESKESGTNLNSNTLPTENTYVPAMEAITTALAPPVQESTHPMPRTAIGTYKDENEVYKFVYVKYNPKSLQAKVDKVVNIGFEQAEAAEKFKIEAVKTGQVI